MKKAMTLRSWLLLFGITIAILPMIFNLMLSLMNNRKMTQVSAQQAMQLTYSDLDHIVENVHGMCQAQNGLAQQLINNALKTSRNILDEQGAVRFSKDESVTWNAINQFTKQIQQIDLPKMLVGEKWLGQNRSLVQPSLVVDKTRDLSVETCTIFQRMNSAGDMLRVCTNVKKLDNTRAIGTYIPAVNPDGSPNAVVSTILKGKTFNGRAFVVNAWYITAYEPIFDANGDVIGILYVGIKQHTLEKSLVEQISKIKVGLTGSVFVLNSKGEYLGLPRKNAQSEASAGNTKDNQGHLVIQEIVKKAKGLKENQIITHKYPWPDSGNGSRIKLIRMTYFKPWDWIICAGSYEDEFLSVKKMIMDLGWQSSKQILWVSACILIVAVLIAILFSGYLTRKIQQVTHLLLDQSDRFTTSSAMVSKSSSRLAEMASQQAASIEETSASMEEMSTVTQQNADNAQQVNQLISRANDAVTKANESMTALTRSIEEINHASEETRKIVKNIDEIAFQTNLLALNAAVEAARAGEAGAGFSVVADEVRNLALRAAQEAQNTAGLIDGIVTQIGQGSELVGKTGDAFSEVQNSARQVGKLMAQTSSASHEQAQGILQVNDNIAEMDKVVQQVASHAQESADASRDMDSQAENMKAHVGELALLVGN